MRMLMSFDTSTTWRCGWRACRWRTTERIWLSVLPIGSVAGSSPLIASVCRNRRPPVGWPSAVRIGSPALMSPLACETTSSRKRLAWRALRATSDSPFLWLSSSSSVPIGR